MTSSFLPFTAIGGLLGFKPLPVLFLGLMSLIVILYIVFIDFVFFLFFKKKVIFYVLLIQFILLI